MLIGHFYFVSPKARFMNNFSSTFSVSFISVTENVFACIPLKRILEHFSVSDTKNI